MPYPPSPPHGIVMAERPITTFAIYRCRDRAPLQTPQRIGQRKSPRTNPGGLHYIAIFESKFHSLKAQMIHATVA
jgi:hypothetical protein